MNHEIENFQILKTVALKLGYTVLSVQHGKLNCSKDGKKTFHWNPLIDDDDAPNLESNITEVQAKAIADFLKECLEDGINVVIHCHAGLCRSGAVAECGVIIGFQDTEVIRIPNTLVKKLILKELGMSNSWDDALTEK